MLGRNWVSCVCARACVCVWTSVHFFFQAYPFGFSLFCYGSLKVASCSLSPSDDHSRVVLTQLDGNPCSDYVNASYIDVSRHSVTLFSFLVRKKTKICFPCRVSLKRTNSSQHKVRTLHAPERGPDSCYSHLLSQAQKKTRQRISGG